MTTPTDQRIAEQADAMRDAAKMACEMFYDDPDQWDRFNSTFQGKWLAIAGLLSPTPSAALIEGAWQDCALNLLRRMANRETWQQHYGYTWEQEAADILATTPKPEPAMSTCDRCGARFPSAPVGTIHKCQCSGGMMVRDDLAEGVTDNGIPAPTDDERSKMAAAYMQPAVEAGEWVMVPRAVIDFLRGEGEIDGYSFGDDRPDERGRFWWRKHLTAAPKAPNGAGEVERDALIEHLTREFGDSYDCQRVWAAWDVGTMDEGDFVAVNDRIEEIADGILALSSSSASQPARGDHGHDLLLLRAMLCLSGFIGKGVFVEGFEDPADMYSVIAHKIGMEDADDDDLRRHIAIEEQRAAMSTPPPSEGRAEVERLRALVRRLVKEWPDTHMPSRDTCLEIAALAPTDEKPREGGEG